EVGAQLLWVGEMCLGPRGVAAGGDRGEQREPPQGTTLTSGHAGPPKCGRWRRPSERARRGGWSSLKPTPWADDRTVTPRTSPAGRTNRLPGRRLRDHAAAEQAPVGVVQRAGLPRRDRPYGLGELEDEPVARALPHPPGHGRSAGAALHECGVARRQRLGEAVHLGELDRVAEQLVSRSD